LHRKWVGIDISPDAEDITKLRLSDEVNKASNLFNPLTDVIIRKDAPERTDNAEEIGIQRHLPKYQTHKPELFGRQQGKCNGCQCPFHYRNLTVDHITSQSKGGTDHIENLQLLCAACNSTKGTGTQAELIERLKEQGVLKY
ncbi:MAG: HNH endonuclease signature motif containing protein, partial [Candidatus Poribacteria bacterium]|nr:HNH endonuclease signature motif containing protein [Candidatus Poribacteria bacterium]